MSGRELAIPAKDTLIVLYSNWNGHHKEIYVFNYYIFLPFSLQEVILDSFNYKKLLHLS